MQEGEVIFQLEKLIYIASSLYSRRWAERVYGVLVEVETIV